MTDFIVGIGLGVACFSVGYALVAGFSAGYAVGAFRWRTAALRLIAEGRLVCGRSKI